MGSRLEFVTTYSENGFRKFISGHMKRFLTSVKLTKRWGLSFHGRRFPALGGGKKYVESREVLRRWIRVARLHEDTSSDYRDFITEYCNAALNTKVFSAFSLGSLSADALIDWLHNDTMFTRRGRKEPTERLVDLLVSTFKKAFLQPKSKIFWMNKNW